MPNLRTRCAISKQRTGYAFKELHRWIDSASEKSGPDHRTERHAYTEKDAETIREYWDRRKGSSWGNKAIVEWLFHIAIDNIDTAFKFSKRKMFYGKRAYNLLEIGIQDSGYIHAAFDRLGKKEMEEKFSRDRPTLLHEVGKFAREKFDGLWKKLIS
jgi:hypothetical protein